MATLLQVPVLLASSKEAPVPLLWTAVMAESSHILSRLQLITTEKIKIRFGIPEKTEMGRTFVVWCLLSHFRISGIFKNFHSLG